MDSSWVGVVVGASTKNRTFRVCILCERATQEDRRDVQTSFPPLKHKQSTNANTQKKGPRYTMPSRNQH